MRFLISLLCLYSLGALAMSGTLKLADIQAVKEGFPDQSQAYEFNLVLVNLIGLSDIPLCYAEHETSASVEDIFKALYTDYKSYRLEQDGINITFLWGHDCNAKTVYESIARFPIKALEFAEWMKTIASTSKINTTSQAAPPLPATLLQEVPLRQREQSNLCSQNS